MFGSVNFWDKLPSIFENIEILKMSKFSKMHSGNLFQIESTKHVITSTNWRNRIGKILKLTVRVVTLDFIKFSGKSFHRSSKKNKIYIFIDLTCSQKIIFHNIFHNTHFKDTPHFFNGVKIKAFY